MPSTYTVNTGIEKPATGEQSGTWGDTVNTNSDILDRALNGVGSITLSGTTHTLTTTDGTLSDGMYRVLVFGGSPSGTNTVTISPNNAQKLYFVQNNSGESIVLTQGSGGNVTIADGKSAIVYADGAGSGAEVVDVTATFVLSGSPTFTSVTAGQVDITGTGDLRLQDTSGGQYVALQAPGTVPSSYTLTLPASDGSSGQVLQTNGSGVLSFQDAEAGVTGPASSTDNGIALFDGTGGSTLKDGGASDAVINGLNIGRGTGNVQTNTAFGYLALDTGSGGTQNIAMGENAMRYGTTGGANTAIGARAMASTTTNSGDYNTGIGFGALADITSGIENTAVGRSSLVDVTTGSNNVAIGNRSGGNLSPFRITTQSNRVVIGDNNITNAYIQVAWTVTSDARDKADVVPITSGLNLIELLNPITFKWDKRSKYWVVDENGNVIDKPAPDGTHKENQPFAGFLAQEVQQAVQEVGFTDQVIVDTEQDDNWKIKETALIPVLVKAVQELSARVKELEARV